MAVLPDLLLAISCLLNFRNSCLSLEKWKPQTKSLLRQATRKQRLTVVKCHRVCESRSRLQVGFAFVDVGFRKNYNSALTVNDSWLGNVMWWTCGNCVPMSAHVYVESSCCAEEATMPRPGLAYAALCARPRWCLHHRTKAKRWFCSDMHKQSSARCWSAVIAWFACRLIDSWAGQ